MNAHVFISAPTSTTTTTNTTTNSTTNTTNTTNTTTIGAILQILHILHILPTTTTIGALMLLPSSPLWAVGPAQEAAGEEAVARIRESKERERLAEFVRGGRTRSVRDGGAMVQSEVSVWPDGARGGVGGQGVVGVGEVGGGLREQSRTW